MNDAAFRARTALALVLVGATLFVALLWMIGAGLASGSTNDGGGHAAGKGLNGYAAFADLLERRGHRVQLLRSEGGFRRPGLLVLTPPHHVDADEVTEAIARHRRRGPVLLVLPKWNAAKAPRGVPGVEARQGWVVLNGASSPGWAEEVTPASELDLQVQARSPPRWSGLSLTGVLPQGRAVQSMASDRVAALVRDGAGRSLAGYVVDGDYPALSRAADTGRETIKGSDVFPVLIVAEPDLLNNYGMADPRQARLALALIEVAGATDGPILFDLTLNGHARSANLLTLAFTPPFLAATLCLLLAAIVVGWRAFLRFGPPRAATRAIAFGKRALVANTAGLIRRAGRSQMIATPYATAARERLARALGLPRLAGPDATERAIDRALVGREADAAPFSVIAAKLRGARKPQDILHAAQGLHALERTLTR